MEYLNNYILLSLWIALAMLFGYKEAKMFHENTNFAKEFEKENGYDIHIMFELIRVVPFLIIATTIYFLYDAIELIYSSLFMLFSFSFFHDGMYYKTRKSLSNGKIYKKGWMDKSTQTTAIFSFNWYLRILLFIIAVLFFLPY